MVFLSSSQNANQVHQQVPRWKESSELRILSWNIFMLPYISLFNNNDQRAKALSEQLNGSDYHICLLYTSDAADE